MSNNTINLGKSVTEKLWENPSRKRVLEIDSITYNYFGLPLKLYFDVYLKIPLHTQLSLQIADILNEK